VNQARGELALITRWPDYAHRTRPLEITRRARATRLQPAREPGDPWVRESASRRLSNRHPAAPWPAIALKKRIHSIRPGGTEGVGGLDTSRNDGPELHRTAPQSEGPFYWVSLSEINSIAPSLSKTNSRKPWPPSLWLSISPHSPSLESARLPRDGYQKVHRVGPELCLDEKPCPSLARSCPSWPDPDHLQLVLLVRVLVSSWFPKS